MNLFKKKKILIPLIFLVGILIFIILLGGSYYLNKNKNINPREETSSVEKTNSKSIKITPKVSVSPQLQNKIITWKTFKMEEANISFEYPSVWSLEKYIKSEEGWYSALIKGKEGEINLTWGGTGYGGGCPDENQEKYLILGEKRTICHWFSDKNEEVFGIGGYSNNGEPYDFVLKLSLNNKDNKELSSKTLSSLKYVK